MSTKQPAVSPCKLVTSPQTGSTADSMHGYYLEKIQELNARLSRLTLMENAREISGICREIIRAKKELIKGSMRTGYIA